MRQLLKKIFRILSAVIVLFTLLSYLCPLVDPARFRWLSFFGTVFPWLLMLNVLMFMLWAWRWNRFALYHLGVMVFGWQFVSGFIGFDFSKKNVPENAISIVTHNVGAMFRGKRAEEAVFEKTTADYAQFLKETGYPEILCTQETKGVFYHKLAAKMGYEHTFNLKKGTVIFSRFPMEAGGDIPFEKTANSSIWVDIRIGKQLVRVYNVHLQSNKVTHATEKVLEEGDLNEQKTWTDIGNVLGKVGSATGQRADQAERLRAHIEACPHPVIVCGDFNDTPNAYVYAVLSKDLTDTFRDKGLGLGSTFNGVLPFLRIDYILCDKSIKTYHCKRLRGTFSDHLPVMAELGW